MKKALIVGDHLLMAGAERLIYELACFSRLCKIEPVILIVNNYANEYYDQILRDMNIRVIRSRIGPIKGLRSPLNIFRTLYWNFVLKYLADKRFSSIQVIGLYNVEKVIDHVIHSKRYFWHVNNSVQHRDGLYPFPAQIFGDPSDTIICINPYQVKELCDQYGHEKILSRLEVFKLFTVSYDPAHSR